MELSFAPLEGVTSHLFRNLHNEMFPGAERYYAPFIAPDGSGKYKASHKTDILPENNRDITLIPQILANAPEPFLAVADELIAMGYTEINLNVGCPSGTVVSKHKGSGMLADLVSLDSFLEKVFSRCQADISVKTRMGLLSTDEFPEILKIYNKYPIKRLTVHARDRVGQYKSEPDIGAFILSLPNIKAEAEYNGNIFSAHDIDNLKQKLTGVNNYMIGRGAVTDPGVFREIKGGNKTSPAELREFHNRLLDAFLSDGLSDYFAVMRMKELWHCWIKKYPDSKKELKALNKSRTLADYKSAANDIFRNCVFESEAHY